MAAMLCSTAVLADLPPGKGNSNKSNHGNSGKSYDGQTNNSIDAGVGLVAAGITAIAARNLAINVGLQGYKPLPPGIAKNLARGKPLPPGIAKRYVPGSLLGQLPNHPGYEWRVAGTDLILVGIETAIVADVLQGVFR
jgi:hypothetical protein